MYFEMFSLEITGYFQNPPDFIYKFSILNLAA